MAKGPIDRLRDGTAPRGLRIAIAEGMFPLDGAELLEAFSILSMDPDTEVQTAISENLPMLPRPLLLQVIHDPKTEVHFIDFLAHEFDDDDQILAGVILNKGVSNERRKHNQ